MVSISAPSALCCPTSMIHRLSLPLIFAWAFHLLTVFRLADAASVSPSKSPAASSVVRTQMRTPFRDLRPPPGHSTDSSPPSVASTFEHDLGFTLDDQGRIYCSERPVGHYTDPGRLTCSRWLYCDGTGHHQWFYCPEGTFFKEDSKSCDFYDELVCLNEEERASRLLLRQTVLLPSSSNSIKDHEQTNFGFINDNELIDVGAGYVTSSIKEDKEARESPGKSSSSLWWRQPRMRQKQKNSRYTKAVEKFYPVAQHQRQLSTKKQYETFFRANNSSKLSHQENNDVTRASFSAVRHVKQQHAASTEDESLPTLTFESVPHSKMLKTSEEGRNRNSDNETQVFAFYGSSSPSEKLEEMNITSWKDFEAGESRSGEDNTAATTSDPLLDLSPVYQPAARSSSDSNDTKQSFSQVIYSVPDTADKMASESKYRYPVLDDYSNGHRPYRPESYGAASHEPSEFAGDEDDVDEDSRPHLLPNIPPPSPAIAMTSPSPIMKSLLNARRENDPVLAFSREFLDDDDDDVARDPADITNHSPAPLGRGAGTNAVTAGSPFGPDYDVPEDSAPYNEAPEIRNRKHQFRTDKNPGAADESIDEESFPKVMTSSGVEDLSYRGFLDRENKDHHVGNRQKGYTRNQKYRYEAEYDDPSPYFSPSGPRRPPSARPHQSHPSISYEDIPSAGDDEQYDDRSPPAHHEHQHTRQEHGKQLRYKYDKPPRRHPTPALTPASPPPRPSHHSIYGNNRYPAQHSIPHQARQHPTAPPVPSTDDYVTAAGGTGGADDLPGSQPVGMELIREPPPPTRHSTPHRGNPKRDAALDTRGRHQASLHTGRFRDGGGQEHDGVNDVADVTKGEPHEGRNYPQPPVSFVVEDYDNSQKPPRPIHHYPPYRPKYQESHGTAGDEHQQEDKTEAEREEEETFLAWLDHQNAINYRLLFGEEQPAQQQSQEQQPYPATANVGSQNDAGGAGGGQAQMLGPVMINGYPITQEHFIDDDGGAGWQSEEQHQGAEYKGSKAMIPAVTGGDAGHGAIRPTWQSFEHYSPPPSGGQSKKPFHFQAIKEEQPSSAVDKSKLEQLMENDDSSPEDEPSLIPQAGYSTDGGIDDTRRARQRDYYGKNPRVNFSSKYGSHGKYYQVSPVRADLAKKQKQEKGFSSLEMRAESGESR